jgi:hypothetical protein
LAVAHGLFYFALRDMSAFHPALRMITVLQKRDAPVKTPVAIDFGWCGTCAGLTFWGGRGAMIASSYEKKSDGEYH